MTPDRVPVILAALTETIGSIVRGADDSVRHILIAAMVQGHVLLEGPPGVAKTLLTRCFARGLGRSMARVQCTPDLMPGDVIGTNVFDFRSQTFQLTRGPVFTEFLLADEVNRTPPKTQSALLEAMQERSVTIDGTTHRLPASFMVIATQNPIEHEGTYPLPEAQLDRFLFKLLIGYPDAIDEVDAVLTHCANAGMPDIDTPELQPVIDSEQLAQLHAVPGRVRIEADVARYVVGLARATREHPLVSTGLSPRAACMLASAARAHAACEGRDYTLPDDVKSLLLPVARHRILLDPEAEMDGLTTDQVLADVSSTVPTPH
jgi:MoxR-like ATPase